MCTAAEVLGLWMAASVQVCSYGQEPRTAEECRAHPEPWPWGIAQFGRGERCIEASVNLAHNSAIAPPMNRKMKITAGIPTQNPTVSKNSFAPKVYASI